MIGITGIILVIIYFIISLAIGFFARKKENEEGFLLANRNVGTFTLTSTLVASLFGGTAVVVTMSFVFNYGISIMWAFISTTLGCFLLALLAYKIKSVADKNKFYTFADFFYYKYGRSLALLAGTIIFLAYLGYLLVQLIAGGIILSTITGWGYILSVILIGGIITIYIAAAGFKAVIRTDVFQFLLLFLLVILSWSIFSNAKTIPSSDLNLFAAGSVNIIGFLVYGIMIMVLGADFWQRIYAAKSVKVARRSLVYTGIIFLFFGVLVVLIGLSVKSNFPDIIPTTALVVGFQQLMPSYLLGLGLVILFAAIMSSADTFLFVLSSSLAKDFFGRFEKFSKVELASKTKWFTIILGIIGIIIAIIFNNIVDVVTSVVGICFALFPATLFSFWFTLKKKAVFMSICLGLLGAINAFIFMGISITSALVSLPVSLIFLGLGQLFFKK